MSDHKRPPHESASGAGRSKEVPHWIGRTQSTNANSYIMLVAAPDRNETLRVRRSPMCIANHANRSIVERVKRLSEHPDPALSGTNGNPAMRWSLTVGHRIGSARNQVTVGGAA